jgi:hypothetical protein
LPDGKLPAFIDMPEPKEEKDDYYWNLKIGQKGAKE